MGSSKFNRSPQQKWFRHWSSFNTYYFSYFFHNIFSGQPNKETSKTQFKSKKHHSKRLRNFKWGDLPDNDWFAKNPIYKAIPHHVKTKSKIQNSLFLLYCFFLFSYFPLISKQDNKLNKPRSQNYLRNGS